MNSLCSAAKNCRASNSLFIQLWWCKYYSAAATSNVNIKIPNRIHRGPTDILKALEKTTSIDLTAPAYRFSDDPYLVPYHDRQARLYSLAKTAGRKAARWVRDEHPELFTQVMSDPPVMSYMPPTPINADTVSEEMLFDKISNTKVLEAMKVYEIMQEKQMDIPQETRLALLQLLCYYNCEDPVPMDNPAERYYGQGANKRKDLATNTWRDHPMVKTLFSSVQELGSAPYSALICGLYNNGAKAEGDELVKEAREKKLVLDVYAYNAMISRIVSIFDQSEPKRIMVMDILKEMNSQGVKPNLATLNTTMDVISRLSFPDKYGCMIQVMKEFDRVGIKPSLGTLALTFRGLVGRTRANSNLGFFLSSVLKSLKGQELEARHVTDCTFFDWLMKSCAAVESLPLAIQALELYLHSNNSKFLDGYRTATFFNNFFHVLSLKADFEKLVKYYSLLVPHIHTASPQFYEVLFEACDVNGAIKEFPEYWKHYLGTGAMNEETLRKMLEVSVNLTGLPDPEALEVRPILGNLAKNLLTYKIETGKQRVFDRTALTTEMCNDLLTLLARGCQWRAVQTCLKFMEEKKMTPTKDSVSDILDNCYDHGNPNMAVWVLQTCHTAFGSKLDLSPMASKIMKSDFLSDDLKKDVKTVIGDTESSSSSSSSDSESSDSDEDSDTDDLSVPRKPNPPKMIPDITKVTEK